MQVILTATDLAAMPTALRQDLLAYLATRRKSAAPSGARRRRADGESAKFDDLAVLDRGQVVTLVRKVSFGRELKGLHDLLEALAYDTDREAPGPERLARLLKLDDRGHLRRYFEAIKRLLKPVIHDAVPLARYSRRTGTYLVHPITRASLREHAGEPARGVCAAGALGRRRRAAMGVIPQPGAGMTIASVAMRLDPGQAPPRRWSGRNAERSRSCPRPWCRSGYPEQRWPLDQAATVGRVTMGASLKGAMVSSVM
jgi:hypothetical protein